MQINTTMRYLFTPAKRAIKKVDGGWDFLGGPVVKAPCFWGFLGGAVVKNLPANAGDMGSSPGPGRSHMLWSD